MSETSRRDFLKLTAATAAASFSPGLLFGQEKKPSKPDPYADAVFQAGPPPVAVTPASCD